MNFTNNLGAAVSFSYLTCFKLLIILALFFLNIYLYLKVPKKTNVLESGNNTKKIQKILKKIVYLSGASIYFIIMKL
jgi:hypothetical protein